QLFQNCPQSQQPGQSSAKSGSSLFPSAYSSSRPSSGVGQDSPCCSWAPDPEVYGSVAGASPWLGGSSAPGRGGRKSAKPLSFPLGKVGSSRGVLPPAGAGAAGLAAFPAKMEFKHHKPLHGDGVDGMDRRGGPEGEAALGAA